MTQRQLNQWVARLRERAGAGTVGRDRVLSACHRAMRQLRGLSALTSGVDDFQLNGELDDRAAALLVQDDALGRIYQALSAPALESAYRATTRERRKFTANEIPAVTQLFTHRWVVEFLLHNTLGRLWRVWYPDSTIHFEWMIDLPTARPEPARPVATIRVLDPACGTMNFGLVAAEMLQAMYREEIDRAGRAGWPAEPSVRHESDIARSILASNLIGIDIDEVALRLARESLAMKFGVDDAPMNLHRGDSLFDTPVKNADIVVTNPPYLSARNLQPSRVARLKRKFPRACRDEYACFIERSLDLVRAGGRVGLLTMHSFMFTAGFEALRRKICDESTVETIAHFGGSLFGVGNPGTLQTVAFTAQKGHRDDAPIVAIRLTDEPDATAKRNKLRIAVKDRAQQFRLVQSDLCALPRGAWSYWVCPATRAAWRSMPTLGQIAPPRQGLATTDNARFVRYWWEVDGQSPEKWRPYAKGGQSRRWYQDPIHRVNWENDGAEIKRSIVERYPYLDGNWQWVAKNSAFYGREGITYSYLTSGRFSARWMPAGSFFDVAGSALFPEDPLTILAILNSSAARKLLHAINPTVNFQIGDLAQLPIPAVSDERLRELAQRSMQVQKRFDEFDETSPTFVSPMPWREAEAMHRAMSDELRSCESEIEWIVAKCYGMEPEMPESRTAFDPVDLARRWVSFAVRMVLRERTWLRLTASNVARIREMLVQLCGSESASQIEEAIGTIDAFLNGAFTPWHLRLYKRRPMVLSLRTRDGTHCIASNRATAAELGEFTKLPASWNRFVDDGVLVNFAPLHDLMADAQQRRYLKSINEEVKAGKYDWSATAKALAKH
jgi:hypothetical protein